MDFTTITLASLLTTAGIGYAAALAYIVVEIAKANFPALDKAVSGALQSTAVLAVLYVAAFVSTPGTSIFTAFLYFVLSTAAALGISSGLDHIQDVRASKAS